MRPPAPAACSLGCLMRLEGLKCFCSEGLWAGGLPGRQRHPARRAAPRQRGLAGSTSSSSRGGSTSLSRVVSD